MTPLELKIRREKHKLTQAQLAQALGVQGNTVSRWETGTINPPKWLDAWFCGAFETPQSPIRVVISNWYGNTARTLPPLFNTFNDAITAGKRACSKDHWFIQCDTPVVLFIDRETPDPEKIFQ